MKNLLIKRAAFCSVIFLSWGCFLEGLWASDFAKTSPSSQPLTSGTRSLYLNGIDISSARSQDLRNVHVKISEDGDIYISAPQYQVTEDETFLPLSSYTDKSPMPEHKSPQAMKAIKTGGDVSEKENLSGRSETAPPTANSVKAPSSMAPAQPASDLTPKAR
jgi:hypothetical protein